jgi:hypothetical protein
MIFISKWLSSLGFNSISRNQEQRIQGVPALTPIRPCRSGLVFSDLVSKVDPASRYLNRYTLLIRYLSNHIS